MDIATIKQRQQATWASGDYAAVGSRLLLPAELLCEAVDLRAGEPSARGVRRRAPLPWRTTRTGWCRQQHRTCVSASAARS